MKKKTVILLTALFFLMTGACAGLSGGTSGTGSSVSNTASSSPVTDTTEALNTVITISIYDSTDKGLIVECFDLIKKFEKKFSRTDPDSEISALNEKG